MVLTLWRRGPPCGRMVVPCTSTQGMRSSSAFVRVASCSRSDQLFSTPRAFVVSGQNLHVACSSCFRTHLSGLRQAVEVVKPAARTACWYIVRQVPVDNEHMAGFRKIET